MNIREVLLQNKVYSSADILRVASYACSSKENFKELMRCFLANEYRLAQRAAGSVNWAAKKNLRW